MKLNDIAYFVDDKISSDEISLNEYITTDCLLQNKKGRSIATNLPPQSCSLTKFKKGDVLIGNIRPYLKKIWFADIDGGSSLDVLLLRAKDKNESAYLYSVLMQDSVYDFVMKAPKGSKMPRGDKNHILTFPCSNVNHKIEIGNFIKSLDDKIALNRRMNAKLKQMAKRLYNHRFVQFDFPNADDKPYKSSGGKMEYNEVLKREILARWVVKSVNDISTTYRGVGYTADDEKSVSDKDVVLILRGNNISNNHIVYDSNTVYLDKSFVSEEQKINKFDIVMTMSSGSKEHIGKSAMFLFDSPHSYGAFCNKITPNKECQFFLENYLHSKFFKKYLKVTCSGTGINNLTNEHFNKAFFAFPIEKLLEYFNEKVGPIYEQMGVLEKEIQKLTALRDRLLPLLMNGQVEVQ